MVYGQEQIINAAKQWLKEDFDPASKKEVREMLDQGRFQELGEMMLPRIAFGTAGLRSKMAPGYHNMNKLIVGQTSYALAQYVKEQIKGAQEQGIVIGYDARYNSKSFAELTARVFQYFGFKVYLFGQIVPTPYVPYGILHLKTSCGIMITASHNPKQDNGYKLYWQNGCQIVSPHDANISKLILDKASSADWEKINSIELKVNNPYDVISKNYMKEIKAFSFAPLASDKQKNVTFTAMHGVGAQFVKEAFEEFGLNPYIPVKEQIDPDPEFSTVKFPNPEEGAGALKLAMQTAEKNKSPLILANDPDADRLAVAEYQDKDWFIFNGNEIALLLADWLGTNFKKNNPDFDYSKCVMINSTVSSKALRALCNKEGFTYADTLTGFKWIGNKADEFIKKGSQFLLGYEVEIGFCVGHMSLDKDGVRVAAIFAEMANYHYQQGIKLTQHLQSLYKKYGYYVMNTRYFFIYDKKVLNQIFTDIRSPQYPTKIGDFKIKYVRDLMTGYDNEQPDNKPVLPPSQMITFTLEDGSSLTLRPSGTEPKIKYYIECCSMEDRSEAEKKTLLLKEAMIKELLKPQQNRLVDPDA